MNIREVRQFAKSKGYRIVVLSNRQNGQYKFAVYGIKNNKRMYAHNINEIVYLIAKNKVVVK